MNQERDDIRKLIAALPPEKLADLVQEGVSSMIALWALHLQTADIVDSVHQFGRCTLVLQPGDELMKILDAVTRLSRELDAKDGDVLRGLWAARELK